MGGGLPGHSLAIRLGFWSSVVILACGAVLIGGIFASAYYLPAALTTGWSGMQQYADAYRASGGTITSLIFLAALVSCPAYVVQITSIHSLDSNSDRRRARLGAGFALAFAVLAGLNYVVQLSIVRTGILEGQSEDLAWLVFQNPGSLMIASDFIGWFFLGLALLSVAPFFAGDRLNRSIRLFLVASGISGTVLVVGYATGNPGVGLVFLTVMSGVLTCVDVLLLVFFRRLMRRPA